MDQIFTFLTVIFRIILVHLIVGTTPFCIFYIFSHVFMLFLLFWIIPQITKTHGNPKKYKYRENTEIPIVIKYTDRNVEDKADILNIMKAEIASRLTKHCIETNHTIRLKSLHVTVWYSLYAISAFMVFKTSDFIPEISLCVDPQMIDDEKGQKMRIVFLHVDLDLILQLNICRSYSNRNSYR